MKTPQEWIDQTDGVRNAPHALMYVRDIAAIQSDARAELEALVREIPTMLESIADRFAEGYHPYTGPSMPSEYFALMAAADRVRKHICSKLARTAPKEQT